MAVHAAKKDGLLLVASAAEVCVENVRMRPEFERESGDFEDVAAQPASIFLCIVDEGGKLVESGDLVGGIGGDEVEATIDGMTVRIDEAGEEALTVEIDALAIGRDGLQSLRGRVPTATILSPRMRDGVGVGIVRIGGKDFRVEEDALG